MLCVAAPSPAQQLGWPFLSHYAHVLIILAKDSGVHRRHDAARVGMIEGTVHRSVAGLIAADLTRVHIAPELPIGDVPDGHAPTPLQQRG